MHFLILISAAATAAAIVASVASASAAGEENNENEDYPKAAVAITVIEAHIIYLSLHLNYSRSIHSADVISDPKFSPETESAPTPSAIYYVCKFAAVTLLKERRYHERAQYQ